MSEFIPKPWKVDREGLELIRKQEGIRLKAYPDPGTGGDPWTIGVGHTGKDVHPGLEITEEEAMRLLAADVQGAERCLEREVTVELTQHMVNALVSFIFNVGCGAFHKSTLRKKLNHGDYDGAVHEFRKWVHAGHHVLAGLVNRREAEAREFLA